MCFYRFQTYVLILASLVICACAGINPVHMGKFTFEGTVKDESGKPVPNAWVKVRGWETLTDADGKWRQTQVVNCGSLREHMSAYEENDEILVVADGYLPSDEKFAVKHPGWFQSCEREQTIAFDTVLKTNQKKIIPPREESPVMPWPVEKKEKGKYTL